MKIALGTVTISEYDREAIAHYYGENGKASRETCRSFILNIIDSELDMRNADLQNKTEVKNLIESNHYITES